MADLAPRSVARSLRNRRRKSDVAGSSKRAVESPSLPPPEARGGTLSPQQIRYYEAFGFVFLPGLFADDVGRLNAGFEEIFSESPQWETNEKLHFDERRAIIPGFIEKSPLLADLATDPRVVGIVKSLLGDHFEYAESDGNVFSCDTSWHPDTYSAPLVERHVKVSFYLDPIRKESGAIRFLPGTNHFADDYAKQLRRQLDDPMAIDELFGIPADQVPSQTVESTPGDIIVWNFRTIHASFGGGERRRLFSLNFKEPTPAGSTE